MKVAVIFIIVVPGLSLQHRHRHSDSGSIEPEDSRQIQEYDYEQSPWYFYRASKKHKHKKHNSNENKHQLSAELESSNKKYIKNSENYYRQLSKKHLRDNCDSNECGQPEPSQVEQPGLSPGNLVFVPYPYPLVVPPPVPMPPVPMPPMPMLPPVTLVPMPPNMGTNVTTSTAPSLTHVTCNGRKDFENKDNDNYLELLRSLKHRQELPFGNDLANIRPVRHYILQRLLSRVRNVKDINSV